MEIKTKFNIGDEVCTMFQNKVIYFTIGKIEIEIGEKETSIVYASKERYEEYSHITGSNEKYNYIRCEDKIFSTKEELLNSL